MTQRNASAPLTPSPRMTGQIARLALLRSGEVRPVCWSAACFFFVLTSFYLLRPLREAMGIERGADSLPWLMTATMLAMLAANPAFTWLVSRWPRRRFVPATYHFFAVNMVVFFALFELLPGHGGVRLGYVFYVWLSVFNLFVVSLFWAIMADRFSLDQGKRLFGLIAIGGSIGGAAGAGLTGILLRGLPVGSASVLKLGTSELFLVAAGFLELAVLCVGRIMRAAPRAADRLANASLERAGGSGVSIDGRGDPGVEPHSAEPGRHVLEGLRLIASSPFLQLICAYILLFTMSSTFLYIEQGRIMERTFAGPDARVVRAAAFARIDLWVNGLTIATQLFLTGRIVSVIGLGGTLFVLPLLSVAGFAGLWRSPTFAVLFVVQTLRRAAHYALDRPAREALFTLVGADGKYKSKPFIDTFIYRGGDVLGGWLPTWLGLLGVATCPAGVWLSAAWVGLAVALARSQQRQVTAKRMAGFVAGGAAAYE